MSSPNIVLTGFMGTGKTTVGQLLATVTGRDFMDTDEIIVKKAGRPIADIFHEEDGANFRIMEREVTRELADLTNLVIATGGRLMLDPLNALVLGRNSVVFCLTAEPKEIIARLADDSLRRPLLEVSDPELRVVELLAERAEGYGQFREISTSGKTTEAVAKEILGLIEQATRNDEWQKPRSSHLPVRYPGGHYQVIVGQELLPKIANLIDISGPVAVITDTNVGPLYAQRVSNLNPKAIITVPAGEEHKKLDTVRAIYDQLLSNGLDRQSTVIALGGGVVGDIAGFASATYMRGVSFIQCPTTVLSMVDASVGGKTGVDLPQGKNLVGAFKQPSAVFADLDTLQTLPATEFASGMAEIVKHGLIASQDLLERVESVDWKVNDKSTTVDLQYLIVEAILIKRDVVEADPYEAGRRKLLNLGHTFGHAIEHVSGYQVRHGEAVAIGLLAAARLSTSLGYCSPDLPVRLQQTLNRLNLPSRIPADLSPDALINTMHKDKKKEAGRLNFVLIREVGDVFVSDRVPEEAVRQTLANLSADR